MAFFIGGGFPIVFVILFGLWAVASALRFAWAPVRGRAAGLAASAVATTAAGFAGTGAGFVAMSQKIPEHPEWHDDLALTVLIGLGEALAPAILGLVVVTVVSMLAAIGLRRMEG